MTNKFYNINNKQAYIVGIDNKVKLNNTISVFNNIAPLEDELQTDICDMNEEQILYLLRQLNISSNTGYLRIKRIINEYINFTIIHNLSKNKSNIFKNIIKNFTIDNPIYNKYPKDYNDLYNNLVVLFGEPKVDSQYVSHFAFLCLVYLQVPNDEILSLQKQDIDFNNMIIKGYHIPKVFWSPIIASLNTKVLIGRGGKSINVPIDRQNFVIKFYAKDFIRVIIESISKTKRMNINDIGIKNISLENIRDAGMFYMCYQNENLGVNPTIPMSKLSQYNQYKECYW